MLRKAKRLTERLGLNKNHCTTTQSTENGESKRSKSDSCYAPDISQFDLTLNKVSTQASAVSEDDSLSTKSSESEELKNSMLSKSNRPVLSKSTSAPENTTTIYDRPNDDLQRQVSMMDTSNLDFLLSMETQARIDAQTEKEKLQTQTQTQTQTTTQETSLSPRPTRIKFELPVSPSRSRSQNRLAYPKARPIRSLPEEGLTANAMRDLRFKRNSWRSYFFGDREDEYRDVPLPITIGTRVSLKMRPLPTFGYVRFIGGDPQLGIGEYIGVELDHGVGNCDGSINGKRYFDADNNRGVFCKRYELEAVPEQV